MGRSGCAFGLTGGQANGAGKRHSGCLGAGGTLPARTGLRERPEKAGSGRGTIRLRRHGSTKPPPLVTEAGEPGRFCDGFVVEPPADSE